MNTSTPDNNISDATAPSPVTTSTLGTTYSEESPSNSTQQGEQQATIEGPDQMELTGQDTPSWWHDDTQLRRPVSPSSLPHPPPPTAATTTPSTPRTILLSSIRGDDTNEPQPSSEAENELRRKILDIQKDSSIPAKDKARQIQQLMWQGVRTAPANQASSTSSTTSEHTITEGATVSYQDENEGIMGCQHYQRKCKLQAFCCGKIYSCRFCHDEASDHTIVRADTKNMFCMLCKTLQPAAQVCGGCHEEVALYYCDKCKLWDDDPKKSIYHCDDCGICRQGKGLGDDFFHCEKCNICMSMSMQDKHRCIERNLESDCPICGEYMFTSTTTVIFMPCGHCIHKHCYKEYIQTSYQCPTCLKSLGDMTEYFARLDWELERQSMPAEYAKYISHVFCNDCELRSPAKYHFFYHKCAHCSSYNTTVLRTENTEKNTTASPTEEATTECSLPSSTETTTARRLSLHPSVLTRPDSTGYETPSDQHQEQDQSLESASAQRTNGSMDENTQPSSSRHLG